VPVIEAIAWGVVVGALSVFLVGLRRLPWRHAALVGTGFGVVFGTLRLATLDLTVDPAMLVLVGALGGSIATVGSERGERARKSRSAEILAGHPSTPG
jgi:hypothetical protein